MHCSSCGAKVADGTAFCGACGRPIVGYSVGGSTAAGGGIASPMGVPAAAPVYTAAVGGVAYAGFWLRVVAAIIDGFVLLIPTALVTLVAFASVLPALSQMGQSANPMLLIGVFLPRMMLVVLLIVLGSWFYWAGLQSSSWQATVGKKALSLYVTDVNGHRVSFGRASGRFFAGRGIGSIVGLYLLVDCILAGFTEKKQALHDIIAGTLVMRKIS